MSNLSKEEIIRISNKIIENAKQPYKDGFITEDYSSAVKGLLDLYNKEVEKNKKLENDNQVLKEILYGGNVSE